MNIIIVPQWLQKTLQENNVSPTDLIDLNKLRRTLSEDDVVFYTYINTQIFESLVGYNYTNTLAGVEESISEKLYNLSIAYNGGEGIHTAIKELFCEVDPSTNYGLLTYDVEEVSAELILLHPKIGSRESKKSLLKRFIEIGLNNLSLDKVVRSGLFKDYVITSS